MNRDEVVLAAMAAAPGRAFQPVHVQKLFFLLDRKLATDLGGPHFNFTAYDYGPFDQAVYATLEGLNERGLVAIDKEPDSVRAYKLTDAGNAAGRTELEGLSAEARGRIEKLATFVASLSFRDLVSAIYRAYPEMKAKSVFVG